MKICIVSDTLSNCAGTEHSVVMTATRLAARGHEIHVLAYCVDGPVHSIWQRHLITGGVHLHVFNPHETALEEIRYRLQELSPNVLHSIPMESLSGNFSEIALTIPRAAVIGTMTSDPGLNNYWYCDLDQKNLSNYSVIVSPSTVLAHRLVETRGSDIRTVVIPHLIPEPNPPISSGHWIFRDEHLSRRDQIGAITRLREEKGTDFLLSAFAMIAKVRTGSSLTIYGELNELKRSRNVAMALGVADKITWHGPFDGPADIDRIVHRHCLFLLSSLFESMPISLMEILSRGRLCVASDVGAVGELFDAVPGGWVVPVGDSRAMADAALSCLSIDIGPLGSSAMSTFSDLYAAEHVLTKLEETYSAALQQVGSPE